MTISVDISDRLYDYTDEEKAAEAISDYQAEMGLSDEAILAIWADIADARRPDLDRRIIAAVDANGTAKRATDSIPAEIILQVAS